MTIPAGTLVPRDARDFGSYELIAKIATGGMAEIFLARALTGGPKGKVVLKRILPHLAEDEHFVTMFRDEANLASRLIHANVCRVHGLGHHGAQWFIIMEYLHGVALSRMLSRLAKKHQYVDFRIIAGIVVQACEGLHHAHELRDADGHLLNVVHRDVSPPNIMLASDGLVKLLDFGIAKARGANSKTRTGTVKGKNAYMSPEQILGKPLDRRSDIFALGCVMYELLAVKRLFHRESDFLTFKAITEEPIPDIKDRRPDVPLLLRSALTQALARDPNGRWPTARAFSEAVKDAVAPLGGPATAVELKKFLVTQFGDELLARDELLKAADDPDAIPSGPMPSTGSGSTSAPVPNIAFATTDPPPMGSRAPTEDLESVDGELLITDERKRPIDRQVEEGPSMIVTQRASRQTGAPPDGRPRTRARTEPPPIPAITPTPPPPPPQRVAPTARIAVIGPGGIPMSMAPTPAMGVVQSPLPGMGTGPVHLTPPTGPVLAYPPAGSVVGLEEPSADLLRGYRRKNLVRTAIGIAAVAIVGIVILMVILELGGKPKGRPRTAVVTPTFDAAPAIDAVTPPDAASDRDRIIALSKYGFLNLEANAKTMIYIDNQQRGPAPLTRYPLEPGIHHVKAVGPKGKTVKFDVTIYGAKDTDAPMIQWH